MYNVKNIVHEKVDRQSEERVHLSAETIKTTVLRMQF